MKSRQPLVGHNLNSFCSCLVLTATMCYQAAASHTSPAFLTTCTLITTRTMLHPHIRTARKTRPSTTHASRAPDPLQTVGRALPKEPYRRARLRRKSAFQCDPNPEGLRPPPLSQWPNKLQCSYHPQSGGSTATHRSTGQPPWAGQRWPHPSCPGPTAGDPSTDRPFTKEPGWDSQQSQPP